MQGLPASIFYYLWLKVLFNPSFPQDFGKILVCNQEYLLIRLLEQRKFNVLKSIPAGRSSALLVNTSDKPSHGKKRKSQINRSRPHEPA
jgi:hypothetical protein